jgi:hypothetical protein
MLYEFLRDQGSLIAGVLALIAGFLAYRAGVAQAKATMAAADREIAANKEAISAAQEQTRVAQGQIAVTLRLQRRRAAQETYGFLATLEAAMGAILDDTEAARQLFGNEGQGGPSPMAYVARQRIKKTAFEDLRSGCLRLGGQLTSPFLRLDNKIDVFAARWHARPGPHGGEIREGVRSGLLDELLDIEKDAAALRDQAASGMKSCSAMLVETQSSDLSRCIKSEG